MNQAEIARALGLSQSTVSIGLKGDTRVAKKTRDAIQKKAAELGYVPDPNLFALSMYRRKTKGEKIVSGMAWVTNHPTRDGWKSEMCLAYRKGASEQAQKLGYQLYDFWLGDPEISSERLKQILLARGIRGLLFPPQNEYHTKIDFDFSEFAAVSFGYSLQTPAFHMVTSYQHQAIRLAYRSLEARGYRKIGIILKTSVDRRVDRNFSGGYFTLDPNGKNTDFIEPYWSEPFNEDDFSAWYERWRPEAVLVTGGDSGNLIKWLDHKGMTAGKDLAFAELNLNSTKGLIAGVDQQPELIGRSAINVLDSLLSHFEYGIPEQSLLTLVPGIWCDGKSAPPKTSGLK